MKVRALVAPDSFKGTYTAAEVAAEFAAGLRDGGAQAREFPVADGGEGTLDALCAATGAERVAIDTVNAWGAPITADIAFVPGAEARAERVAIVELASAAGLTQPHDGERDPVAADTFGVGVLMHAAASRGAARILVAAGGSATTDGGAGAVRAIAELGGLGDASVVVLADVQTTFVDAARVFAPQKGADPGQVEALAERLREQAKRAPRDPSAVPGSGAAGGFAGGMWAHHGATIEPGAAAVLDASGFDDALADADLVVVGEGRLDEQTASGKIVDEIVRRVASAATRGGRPIPVAAIVGSVSDDLGRYAQRFHSIRVASSAAAMRDAGRRLASEFGAS